MTSAAIQLPIGQTSRIRSAVSLALAGFAIALWTSAMHLALVVMVRALRTEMYWHWSGRDVFWIVPLGYVVIFALPIALASTLHAALPRIAKRHVVLGLCAGLGLFAVLLLYAGARSWALALLSIGGGIQFARLCRSREATVVKVLRRGAVGFAAFFAVFGGGGAVRRARAEQRALATLQTVSGEAPNVLLIILDTVRASSMSVYGALRPTTPRLAQWAKRGVTFDHAYAPSSWTLASHASMFTGTYPSQHSGDWTSPLDAKHRTVAEVFRDHGYATGGFSANQNAGSYEAGLGRGFITYRDTKRTVAEVIANTTITQGDVVVRGLTIWRDGWLGGALRQFARFDFRPGMWGTVHDHKPAPEVVEQFLRWQSSLGGRPFFAFLNFFDAHATARIPAHYRSVFAASGSKRDTYDGALRYLDDQVSDMLEELERRAVYRNTIVIIASDHGEHLGEHGLSGHGNSLYRELLRVPLIILNADSTAAGRRVATQVTLRDVAATALDLTGLPLLPGRSLAPHWRSAHGESSPVIAEVSRGVRDNPKHPTAKGDMVAVLDDSLHIIRNGDGSLEAYAYRTDTTEAQNLATASARPTLRARFAQLYRAGIP